MIKFRWYPQSLPRDDDGSRVRKVKEIKIPFNLEIIPPTTAQRLVECQGIMRKKGYNWILRGRKATMISVYGGEKNIEHNTALN